MAFKVIEFAKNFVLLDVKFNIVRGIFVFNFDVLEVIGEGLDYWLDGAAAVGKELDDVDDRGRVFGSSAFLGWLLLWLMGILCTYLLLELKNLFVLFLDLIL